MSQFGVTICLAVSLKAMWNLMHVMQVMAFLRLLIDMPANSNMMLQSMHNAITLDNVMNSLYESVMPEFSDPEEEEYKEELKDSDIPYENIYLSLGIFGLVFVILLLAVCVYFLLKCMSVRMRCCAAILATLKAKLFYNAWVRYMIESNLKVTSDSFFYLFVNTDYNSFDKKIQSAIRIVIVAILIIWPLFVIGFLHWRRSELENEEFKKKFISMYVGIKIKKMSSLMYTSVFCFRRLLLVLAFVVFGKNVVFVIVAYNVISTFYFWYMTSVVPHEENIHNRLEYFDELCLILILYMMTFFLAGSDLDPMLQWDIGSFVMGIVFTVFVVHVIALIYLTIVRVIFWCRVRKAR